MNKKLLITFIGAAFCGSSFATTPKDINKVCKINKHYSTNNVLLDNSSFVKPNTIKTNTNSFSSKVTGKLKFVEVGSSPNLYTALVSESNCLTANQELNTVMFTKRINSTQVDINAAGSTGIIQTSYSIDGGLSFDTTLTIVEDPTNKFLCRYPSGSIINPKGNKNPAKAFFCWCCKRKWNNPAST
jgi:hypothetical protein